MTSRTERILIIDSDERARSELGRYLEARGFYVTGYSDLASARSLFDDNIPDIIFADLSPDAIVSLPVDWKTRKPSPPSLPAIPPQMPPKSLMRCEQARPISCLNPVQMIVVPSTTLLASCLIGCV